MKDCGVRCYLSRLGGVSTQIRRAALRRETSRIDGRGNVTRTEYDALGRVAATIDALANATTYAYDPMGRVAAITNALGDATVYEYDHRPQHLRGRRHRPQRGGRHGHARPADGRLHSAFDRPSALRRPFLQADQRFRHPREGRAARNHRPRRRRERGRGDGDRAGAAAGDVAQEA